MQDKGILRHWYWFWLISAGFVVLMTMFFLTKYPAWLHYSYRGVSLTHEMSYGVWWSAIGLFMAAIIYANVGALSIKQGVVSWPWFILSLAFAALCADEIGSLHETVARVAGWQGLLPFAVVFGIGFMMALIQLSGRKPMRLVIALVLLGVGIFATVAGLEFIEHNPDFLHPFWRRARLVAEEASELIAIGILITAGLIAMRRMGDPDRRFINATRVVERLYDYPAMVFTVFALQLLITLTVIVPNYTFFPEGIPSAFFPVCLFFCLGILAQQHAQGSSYPVFWKTQAVILFVVSIMQMYNLNVFLNNLFLLDVRIFVRAPFSWITTLVPFLMLAWLGLKTKAVQRKEVLAYLFAFFLAAVLVLSEMRLRFRVEFLYLSFSSLIAYSCYQLQSRLRTS